jgi:hypothetical protein
LEKCKENILDFYKYWGRLRVRSDEIVGILRVVLLGKLYFCMGFLEGGGWNLWNFLGFLGEI